MLAHLLLSACYGGYVCATGTEGNGPVIRVGSIQCISDLDIILLATTWPSSCKHPLTDSNADAGQEHTGILHKYTHRGTLQTRTHTNMKLVLKFASTPAAHTLRFTHTVSTQWHKQACPQDTEQLWCCSYETPLYSLCVEELLFLLPHFSPHPWGPSDFLASSFNPRVAG